MNTLLWQYELYGLEDNIQHTITMYGDSASGLSDRVKENPSTVSFRSVFDKDPIPDNFLDHGYSLLPTDDLDMSVFIGNMSNMSVWLQGGTGDPGTNNNDPYTVLEWCRDIVLGILLAALSMVTFIGNAMVLHAVRTERRLQSVTICIYY